MYFIDRNYNPSLMAVNVFAVPAHNDNTAELN